MKIIDLFAGPGGLGEGFSAYRTGKKSPFQIALSIEMDPNAHKTLSLRAFYRQFKGSAPQEYYDYLAGIITKEMLFKKFPKQAEAALKEAWQAELGSKEYPHDIVKERVLNSLKNEEDCILIGGPPCQAYSLAGRVRMQSNPDFAKDPRHTLYLEYLRILTECHPAVFVMENVKGILSSKLDGQPIFPKILEDLKNPYKALNLESNKHTYKVYSLVESKSKKEDFVIKSEEYGIPQARHRVILIGVRSDINIIPSTLKKQKPVSVKNVIDDLPKLRSGLSKGTDSYHNWKDTLLSYHSATGSTSTYKGLSRGANYISLIETETEITHKHWYSDKNLKAVINHETRSHISSDIHRYIYAAQHAERTKISPKLNEFPEHLLPNHKNVNKALSSKSLFNDRFRVQVADKPATTITSHISKDGHYFIHYDSKQARSLTVREAARIQTFPDNYKFEGPRTAQYHQVGNAVPPLLAHQIADIVYKVLKKAKKV